MPSLFRKRFLLVFQLNISFNRNRWKAWGLKQQTRSAGWQDLMVADDYIGES